MINQISLSRIDELLKYETLKKQYACMLFEQHKNMNGEIVAGMTAAFKAAEEFLKIHYPFVLLNTTSLALYIADTWPKEKIVFEHYLMLKEAEAQGEFFPNKAQFIMNIVNMLDRTDEKMETLSKESDTYKEWKSLRENALELSKLLRDLMGWKI